MRYRPRLDANHNEIAAAVRKAGWSCISTAGLGDGAPDLLCGKPRIAVWLECKDGAKPPSARQLTLEEKRFAERYTGPYEVVLSPEDALEKLKKWG